MARRIAAGLRVNDDTIAAGLIKGIGPRGQDYLTSEHTLRWLRSDEYVQPRLSIVGARTLWERRGSPDVCEVARQKVRRWRALQAPPMPAGMKEKLAEIIASFGRVDSKSGGEAAGESRRQ